MSKERQSSKSQHARPADGRRPKLSGAPAPMDFRAYLHTLLSRLNPWHGIAIFAMIFVWTVILLPKNTGRIPTAAEIQALPDPIDEERQRMLNKVNKHLQYVEKQKELHELDAQLLRAEMENDIDPARAKNQPPKIDYSYERLSDDNQAEHIYEDLKGGAERRYDTPLTPKERINSALEMRRWMKDYEEHQIQEYIREYVENAREQGYEVKINDKLEVVEIRRIPTNKAYKGLRSIRNLSSE